jgi:hypothetical protein
MQMKLFVKQAFTAVAAFGFVAAGASSASAGDHVVSSAFNLASKLNFSVGFDCSNHPGPSITLGGGSAKLGPVSGQLVFANNFKLTHENDQDVTIRGQVIVNDGTPVQIPKQPSRPADYYGSDFSGTGVGGNPWIYLQLNVKKLDGSDYGPILLGRCVQGAAIVDLAYLHAVLSKVTVTHDSDDSCTNNPGPYIYVKEGILSLSGVKGQIIFTNNRKFTHAAYGDAVVDFDLVIDGTGIIIPKQPPLGGVGGNPHVWFNFLNDGKPVATFPGFYLGRCVQDL